MPLASIAPGHVAGQGLRPTRRPIAVAAVLSAMALVVLDAGIANVALPIIARSLAVAPAAAVLVITAYQTALVMALLPVAAIGERLGCRKVFVAGIGLFTAASLFCAVATSLPLLLAARFLQGLGGAAVMALGVALLRAAMPEDQLGRAIGWNALTVALAAAVGPALGALVLALAPWPWLFAINLPIGVVALTASVALPAIGPSSERLDVPSMILSAIVFGAPVAGAELGFAHPMFALAAVVLAVASLAALIRRERAKASPVIPIDLLGSGSFRISVIASTLCFSGQGAALVALPFLLQNGLRRSAFATGLFMAVWPLSVAATAPVPGRLADRFSTAWLCAIGATILAAGLGIAALSSFDERTWLLAVPLSLCGIGFGLFNVPNNRNMFLSAPRRRSAAAGGLQATARLSGQAAGAVLMTVLFTLTAGDLAPRIGLFLAALLVIGAGLVSTRPARRRSST